MNALKYAEGAGQKCERKGESGEGGCWQFMPSTWRLFTQEIYGEFREMTPERERYVVTMMVEKWTDQGMSASQIALRWNAGGATKCSRGVNKLGVEFDSCAHVSKVLAYLNN